MSEPPSPTVTPAAGRTGAEVIDAAGPTVVGSDEQDEIDVDVARWAALARAALAAEGARGELTLTFVDRAEIAALNAEHLGGDGATDVLSFPLDDVNGEPADGVPLLLGDVVVCPAVAAAQSATHAGTLDDELALLVVHGVLHVLGHDHAVPDEAARMRRKELELLERHHWVGRAPSGFRQVHDGDEATR